MKLASRLIIHVLPLAALGGCDAPSNNQAAQGAQSLSQQACERQDVQAVVGKEVKSILYKGWFEHAGTAVMLFDPDEIGTQFKQAQTSFHDVEVYANSGGSASMDRVVCQAVLQIDESNELRGQSILQFRKLRWSIDFGQTTDNPQTAAFSIVLDQGSLGDDVRLNGEPIEASKKRERADADQASLPSSGGQSSSDVERQAEAARAAVRDAATTLDATEQDARSAAAQVERELQAELAK